MEKPKNGKIAAKTGPDLNGNEPNVGASTNGIKDQIVTDEGRVFYPCQFCNKVFQIKKARSAHVKTCSAKDYILSVNDTPKPANIPDAESPTKKIAIQQNILLNEQVDISEILSKSKTVPLKLTIRRSPGKNGDVGDHFTVTNSIVLKEKNESNEDFTSITKRLENNAVTITKQPVKETSGTVKAEAISEFTCKECTKEFGTQIELLRHSRECHKYPRVLMAMSEVEKFYAAKDRSECPICHKPLKTNFRSAFVKHLHTHTNEMKYSCMVCHKKFRRHDHMKAHEKRHIVKDKKK